MNRLREAIQTEISIAGRGVTRPMRGIIPPNSIDIKLRQATKVIIPSPGAGIAGNIVEDGVSNNNGASTNSYTVSPIILRNVPLPSSTPGVIESTGSIDNAKQRACLVGFRGDNLSFPYIINFIDIPIADPGDTNVSNRSSTLIDKIGLAGGPGTVSSIPRPGIRNTKVDPVKVVKDKLSRVEGITPSIPSRSNANDLHNKNTLNNLLQPFSTIINKAQGVYEKAPQLAPPQSSTPENRISNTPITQSNNQSVTPISEDDTEEDIV